MIQFIKGSWKYGEMESVKRTADLLDFHVMCKGFVFKSEDQETDVRAAQEAWELAEQTMAANQHQLVILDELTYLIKFPVSYYPEWIQWLIALLPLTHASHAIRAAVLTQPLPALSFVYLVLFALVVFGFAVRVVQLSQN